MKTKQQIAFAIIGGLLLAGGIIIFAWSVGQMIGRAVESGNVPSKLTISFE